jgi:N-acetylglutamate synthase-like GNAT family acetyltransferase
MKPYLEQILALGGYEERALGEMAFYERFKDEYPAHLHIDILEAYTGSGNGKALIARALETMRADGVKGVILGVAKANERACRFYQACGFRILEEDDRGYAMGMSLAQTADRQTERIREMEARMERTEAALRQLKEAMDNYASCQKDLDELRGYYEGGAWQKDYEADERGEIPTGLRRGVLGQDALYDLLAETDRMDRILSCAEESEEE